MRSLALLVPGPIDQLTGGYLYARRLVAALRAQRCAVAIGELAGRFPDADREARTAAAAALAALPPGAAAVIDGLALAGFVECLESEARRLRVIALLHHPLALETGLSASESERFAAIEARLLPLCRGVICPSAATARAVRSYGVDPARIAIVLPGTIKPARLQRRAAHDGPLRLLAVGTVTARKGHLLLIEALARLAHRDWRLAIIGSLARDPATVAALRRSIAAHALEARVALLGEWPQERLARAYEESDVFVLPSHHEGYGMAFAEALVHGLPIIATAAGAVPEVVPASAGVLVPPGDAAALAAALDRLIEDSELRARLAAGAAAAGAALPDWSETARRWSEAAERFLA